MIGMLPNSQQRAFSTIDNGALSLRAADAGSSRGAVQSPAKVVIVTPRHLASNPRVIKEADVLFASGFDVHVVFAQRGSETAIQVDQELLATRRWTWTAVRYSRGGVESLRWALATSRHEILKRMPSSLWRVGRFGGYASERFFSRFVSEARAERGDLYIGHYPEGLAVAAAAAEASKAQLAFDAEDLHTGEPNSSDELARADLLQRRYLPRCAYVTAASEGISEALASDYGIPKPTTVFNTFPLADRQRLDGRFLDRRGDDMSLYWYSQVIGLDRGIQDVIRAAGRLGGPVQIHLRGSISGETKRALKSLADENGVSDRLFFHSPVSPGELLSRAAEHDVGLALEQGLVRNRSLCTTNKLFFYLLAGLAVAATSVPGQSAVLNACSNAAELYQPGDVSTLARILETWRTDPTALERSKSASLACAQERWNWEYEGKRLVGLVRAHCDGRFRQSETVGLEQ